MYVCVYICMYQIVPCSLVCTSALSYCFDEHRALQTVTSDTFYGTQQFFPVGCFARMAGGTCDTLLKNNQKTCFELDFLTRMTVCSRVVTYTR